MQELLTLYEYIRSKYNNYQTIKCTSSEIVVVFHNEFEMKILLQNFYNVYFNGIFYYSVDWQDIKDTIDDVFTNNYVFCQKNNKLKIVSLKDYRENAHYTHAWTIEKTLK